MSDVPKTSECLWCGARGAGMRELCRAFGGNSRPTRYSSVKFECVDRAACDKRIRARMFVGTVRR